MTQFMPGDVLVLRKPCVAHVWESESGMTALLSVTSTDRLLVISLLATDNPDYFTAKEQAFVLCNLQLGYIDLSKFKRAPGCRRR